MVTNNFKVTIREGSTLNYLKALLLKLLKAAQAEARMMTQFVEEPIKTMLFTMANRVVHTTYQKSQTHSLVAQKKKVLQSANQIE